MTSFTVLVSGTSLGCIEKGVRERARLIQIFFKPITNLSRDHEPSVSGYVTAVEFKQACLQRLNIRVIPNLGYFSDMSGGSFVYQPAVSAFTYIQVM